MSVKDLQFTYLSAGECGIVRAGQGLVLNVSFSMTRVPREEHEEYARLFAAAPDMLEALRLAQSSLSTYAATGAFTPGQPSGWLLNQLSAAIAKAEGR